MYTILGATGRTGSILTKELLSKGKQVRAIGRDYEKLKSLEMVGAEPFVIKDNGDENLVKAFSNSKVIYVVLVPDFLPDSDDFRSFQNHQVDLIVLALKQAENIENIVVLSSWGAENEKGVGPVEGLHYLEQQIGKHLKDKVRSIVLLRVGYFMENLIPSIQDVKNNNNSSSIIVSTPIQPEISIPLIATKDIGISASKIMLNIDQYEKGIHIVEVHGSEYLTLVQVTEILSKHYNKQNVVYKPQSLDQLDLELQQVKVKQNVIDLFLDVYKGVNNGFLHFLQPNSIETKTETTFNQFLIDFDNNNIDITYQSKY
eukprot:gene9680-11877_t